MTVMMNSFRLIILMLLVLIECVFSLKVFTPGEITFFKIKVLTLSKGFDGSAETQLT